MRARTRAAADTGPTTLKYRTADVNVLGPFLAVLGVISTVVGLVDLPQQGRRWAGLLRHLRGEQGRWAAVVGGLVLQASATFFGVPASVTFAILLGAVFVAATVRFYQARQGLPNWRACHEWPDPIQGEERVVLAVRSLDGAECRIALCRVSGPHGRSELDHANNIFGNEPQPTDRDETPFPDPRFSNAPDHLADGKYRVQWWARQGVGLALVRRDSFRVKKGMVTRVTRCMYEDG